MTSEIPTRMPVASRSGHRRNIGWFLSVPVTIALVLCSTGLRFPFLFEDYDLLSRAQVPGWREFLPDPLPIFYRPLSREGYFTVLTLLGGTPLAGHVLNFLLVISAILLLYAVAARLLGAGAALVAAFLLATFSQVPVLVSWVSGCQDLLAINLILLALWAQTRQQPILALGAATLALLSKEIAIGTFPALAASGWVLARGNRRPRYAAIGYVLIGILWVLVHPLTRILLERKLVGAETGYIGLDNPGRWLSVVRSMLTLLNVPSSRISLTWLAQLALPVLLAAAMILASLRVLTATDDSSREALPSPVRVGLFGLALALPPLLLTSLLVRHWSPYYVALPAIGGSLALAAASTIVPRGVVPVALCAYLALGVCTRAMPVSPGIPSEVNLDLTGRALKTAETQFRALQPTLPRGARVLVYVLDLEQLNIRGQLCRYKAPRWWYRDPAMEVTSPELRAESPKPEFLFWVSPDLTVHEVDLSTLRPRSIHGQANYLEYQVAIRAYARGLADSGQLDRAVAILLRMPEIRPEYRNLDDRLAAMLLLKYGRDREASRILDALSPLSRGDAVLVVANILELNQPRPLRVEVVMRAFSLSPSDPDALRAVLRTLRQRGSFRLAAPVALELLNVLPGDLEAKDAAADSLRGPWPEFLTVPTP